MAVPNRSRIKARTSPERPRLVMRFALWSLAAFVMIGTLITLETVRQVRSRAEELATQHASFVADAVLAPALRGQNLSQPLPADVILALDSVVRDRIIANGSDVRVKVWASDGTVAYSDEHRLIGRSFPDEAPNLALIMRGDVSSSVTDLEESENLFERPLAAKLFQTYVPLTESGKAIGVAEVYQRYAVIDGDVHRLLRALFMVFGGGLLFLYAVLLPIILNASRSLRERNAKLSDQADQLGVLLEREQQTVAELRALDRMKDDFVAATSHELRTPLTAIIGTLRTLEHPALAGDEQTRGELISAARQRAELLFRLVRNLLRGAHLEDGAGELDLQDVDLSTLLETTIRDFPDGAVRVRVDLGEVGRIRTDGRRLSDILSNLIDNALKFSPAPSTVSVKARVEERLLVVEVRDHGIGIEPKDLGSIFDRFHQLDQSATRPFGGLGLGLHLVKEMINEMGGRVWVSSVVGHGSVFSVSIPVQVVEVRQTSDAI